MPPGYTHAVQDGKITTLRDYALCCARAFGALIEMRDDPSDAPIPEVLEPRTNFYDEMLIQARTKLDFLAVLPDDQCEIQAKAAFEKELADHTKYESDRYQEKLRYEKMLEKVSKWQVTDDLRSLKDFMAEQLRTSIGHDCSTSYSPKGPIRLTGQDWRRRELEKASRDLAYGTEHRNGEIQRTNERNQWLSQLRGALPDE